MKRFRQGFFGLVIASVTVVACSGWEPSRPFDRESPEVREAVGLLGDGGDAAAAGNVLEEYLATGQCKEGSIGTPPRVRERSNGGFDLGLALFELGEKFGRRFGDEEVDAGAVDENLKSARGEQVDCALKVVQAIGTDLNQPIDLRARARYLEGNLRFMTGAYEEAVRAYDASLELAPGMNDSGPITAADSGRVYSPDLLGRDAAWNRAIALRRIEDKKDAGNDAGQDGSSDASDGDSGKNDDQNKDGGGDKDKPDAGGKDGGGKDAGQDSGSNNDDNKNKKPDEPRQDPKDQPQSRQNQDERMLDQLENAPTVQQEAAKKQGRARKVRGMSDK